MGEPKKDWTKATVVAAEGARVAFLTCLRCGAVVLADPRDDFDVVKLHDDWHGTNKHG